jgi:MATE family multidrug resistance protein
MDEDYQRINSSFITKYKNILKIFVPTAFSAFIIMSQEMINLWFVGMLNNSAMIAGVGTGNVIINMLGNSIIFGMNGAMNTFVSQSYGQGNMKLVGIYLNRARLVMTLSFVPVAFILLYIKEIMIAIGQDQKVSEYSKEYVMAFLPGLYFLGLSDL